MEENKSTQSVPKTNKVNIRFLVVVLVLLLFVLGNVISLRGKFLAITEINSDYLDVFFNNLKLEYSIFGVNFVVIFLLFYITNLIIRRGLKPFFKDDNVKMPKLPNKSISFIIAIITSFIAKYMFSQKYMLLSNIYWFGINDPVFNNDISYYMYILPFIKTLIFYCIGIFTLNLVYLSLYYVITFNVYLNGVDRKLLKDSLFIKQVIFNSILIVFFCSAYIWGNSESILTQNLLNIKDSAKTALIGAGKGSITVKYIGYKIFSIIIFIIALGLVRCVKKQNFKRGAALVLVIPSYLVGLFFVMVYYDYIFMGSNEFDKQKTYIGYNINYTEKAYGIDINQVDINNYETITSNQVEENREFLDNIPLLNQDIIKQALEQNQEDSLYYSYNNSRLSIYDVNGKPTLAYLTPREVITHNRTYNNLTYEYTHGYSVVLSSASKLDKNGYPEILNENSSNFVTEPRIYFGRQTNSDIIVNSDYGKEYDYLNSATQKKENTYDGDAGVKLGFLDRLVVGIRDNNLKIAFSGYINENSKIITNRNIIERVETIMPNLIYDEPYMVVTDSGKLVWVIDAYTTSKEYPYSQFENYKGEKINYIRNSVKVLVDSYNGTTNFYIMDETDPIIQSYKNMYPSLFAKTSADIPSDISKHFTYPELLYSMQSDMINLYHGASEDVLYRGDNVWQISSENTKKNSKISPYFTLVNTIDSAEPELGLMVTYNKAGKQSTTAYLVGTVENGENQLTLYKFDSNTSIAGISQVNNQIDQDEIISKELENLNTTGTKLIREMEIVPLENTLLYIERVYQVMLNDDEAIPVLKKVIVASGNVLAMGNNLDEAISNLYTDYSIELDLYDAEDMDSLIDSIIKANNNLKESMNSNNFEMVGKDLTSLENLIEQLEVLQKKNKENNNDTLKLDIFNNEDEESENTVKNSESYYRNISSRK